MNLPLKASKILATHFQENRREEEKHARDTSASKNRASRCLKNADAIHDATAVMQKCSYASCDPMRGLPSFYMMGKNWKAVSKKIMVFWQGDVESTYIHDNEHLRER